MEQIKKNKSLTPTEARTKWVEALRSGKFTQGKGRLQREDGSYCCLGVACEIYSQLTKNGEWTYFLGIPSINPVFRSGNEHANAYLPETVRKWLGLFDRTGKLVNLETTNDSLAKRNDLGTTFEEIATMIESGEVQTVE